MLYTCTSTNAKIASVCASADLSAKSGYIIYRYGTANHIELTLPARPTEFRQIMMVAEFVDDASGEDDAFVRFRNGDVSYVGYYGIGKKFNVEGLAVFNKNKLLKIITPVADTSDWSLALNGLLSVGVPLEYDAAEERIFKVLLPGSSVAHSRAVGVR